MPPRVRKIERAAEKLARRLERQSGQLLTVSYGQGELFVYWQLGARPDVKVPRKWYGFPVREAEAPGGTRTRVL